MYQEVLQKSFHAGKLKIKGELIDIHTKDQSSNANLPNPRTSKYIDGTLKFPITR